MSFDNMKHMAKENDGGLMAEVAGSKPSEEEPHYSYGLALTLDDDDLKKVGMDCDDPDCQTGNYIHLEVLAKVTGVHKMEAGHSLNLQITHMCIEDGDKEPDGDEDDHYDGKVLRAAGPY